MGCFLKRILIIDDDSAICEMLSFFLSSKGYLVETRSDALDVESVLDEGGIDLLISDIFMPDKDGLEVLMDLRESVKSFPIIAISGGLPGNGYDPLLAARHLGAVKTFAKPLDLNELLDGIREVLGEK